MAFIEPVTPPESDEVARHLGARLQDVARRRTRAPRPAVTLSYAQSLDGSIAIERGKPVQLSNAHSQSLTHRLRALHDAVLVGINTVLSDDPQLTVRLVPGKSPQPVVLDSRLRFPVTARLLRPPCVPPLIITTVAACSQRERRLRDAGAQIVRLHPLRDGFIDLGDLLSRLHELGIRSLMVEGGAAIITSFLSSAIVDQLILTIVPRVLGGIPAVTPLAGAKCSLGNGEMSNVSYHSLAGDLVVFAEFGPVSFDSEYGPATSGTGHGLAAGWTA